MNGVSSEGFATGGVRTRFAPSPTGSLHLGNVRIAVFNWLFARHHGGAFVLRIEDTDVERNVEGSEEGIYRDLRWLGLQWDEGPDVGGEFGPYRQSQREDLYREYAARLVDVGRAYPCFCTEEELRADAEETADGRSVLRYSGRCRNLSENERRSRREQGLSHSIRVAVPLGADIQVIDEIRGPITFPRNDIDDFIIMRSDGRPTYNFAVVVDDVAMAITHVIRGAGHLSNTPKQAVLFDAMGHERPRFIHLPTVLSPDGGKLSKREDAAAVSSLRDQGYHPDAVVNYLSLLGWSSESEEEFLHRDRLVREIAVDRLGASDTTFDPEKLRWLSGKHLQEMSPEEWIEAVRPRLGRRHSDLDDEELARALEFLAPRIQILDDVEEALDLIHPGAEALEAAMRNLTDEDATDGGALPLLTTLRSRLAEVAEWTPETTMDAVREGGREAGARGRELFHPIRRALTAATSGPDLGGTLWALGREESLRRLDRVIDRGKGGQ